MHISGMKSFLEVQEAASLYKNCYVELVSQPVHLYLETENISAISSPKHKSIMSLLEAT
jgi:hypothetical protein